MAHKFKGWRVALVIALCGFMWWIGSTAYISPVAADPRLESQINRLESELGRLRTQVSRIESQLLIPNRSSPSPRITSPPVAVEPSLEEQFDNLATLVIETKLQVRDLEARIARLEANRNS